MPSLRSHAFALIAASTLAPGCVYYGAKSRDVDRTPIVDTGVGATVLMPGQSAPAFPGSSGSSAVPGSPESGGAGQPGSGSSSGSSSGTPAGGGGLTMIGGTRVDEVTHTSSHEEPIWLKYLTLPFALVAAPFVAVADAVQGEEKPGPEVPRVDPPRPQLAAKPPAGSYDDRMIDGLERELDQRQASSPPAGSGGASARGAAGATGAPSIADELASLQRTPAVESAPPRREASAAPPTAARPPARADATADGIVDRNEDGRIDLWIYREDGEIVRRVLDEDFDGRPDQTLLYDRATHRVSRVEEDANRDGSVDNWTDYQDGEVARRRGDTNHDGAVDTWTFYRGGEVTRHEQDTTGNGFRDRIGFYEAGKLVREEQDTTGSGRADVIVHYDADERVVRRDEDTDRDGRIDVISYYENGRLSRRELIDAAAQAPQSGAALATP
jgi:hypothetical protein